MSLNVLTQGGGTGGATASIFVTGLTEADAVTATKDGKTVNGKWVQKPLLPEGYTPLEYIESTGTQYIDTGVVPSYNFEAAGKFLFTSIPSSKYGFVLGAATNYNASPTVGFGYDSGADWNMMICGNQTDGGSASSSVEYEFEFVVVSGNQTLTANGVNVVSTYETEPLPSTSLFLFAKNAGDGTSINTVSVKLWRTKMYKDNVIIRDYIPCINPIEEVGLYDIVNGVFYGNNGTGTFVAGAEIPSTIDGHVLTIKKYGMWTVTATNGEDTATQDVLVDAAIEFTIPMSLSA